MAPARLKKRAGRQQKESEKLMFPPSRSQPQGDFGGSQGAPVASALGAMPDDEGYDANCAMVPLNLIANEGGSPEPGDAVSFNVSGIVESVDGDQAKVRFQQIDGQDLPDEPSDAQQQESMRSAAESLDASRGQSYGADNQ